MVVHEGHADLVCSVAFSPDGKSVVSGSQDETVRIWDARRTSPIGRTLGWHSSWVQSVSYSPLGNLIASGSEDATIRLWDPSTGQQSGNTMDAGHLVSSVAFSPDGKLIASGYGAPPSARSAVQLWNVQTKKVASGPFNGHTDWVWSVLFSPDGTRLVSGSHDKTIRVWDVERGATILHPFKGHTNRIRSVAFSPDGAQISSCSDDRTIRLWDSRTGGTINELFTGHTSFVNSISFSPRGTYIAFGAGNTVCLWDIRTGRQLDERFPEHNDNVMSVAFSPCGQYIASGSHDCRVIIRKVLSEDQYPVADDNTKPQMVTSQMSTQQIFECLCRAGCIDLSSKMDSRQETAMIMSGGGFGDIWKGSLDDGGKVAIKAWRTIAFGQCEYKTLKRAARELYLWSRMDHPHIHRLQGVILFRDQYLGMVSEWMDNGNLHEYIRKHPDTDRFQLCVHVASGLKYMHRHNTVHGDLKAVNVLVSLGGVARISDFDFSIMSDASNLVFTATSNNRTGSVRWLAPEMLDDEKPKRSTQADMYALGMTMLEIFSGEVPYPERRIDGAVIRAVMQGILPPRPVQYLQDDDHGNRVWRLLLDCWSRDTSKRPSARRVLRILELGTGKG